MGPGGRSVYNSTWTGFEGVRRGNDLIMIHLDALANYDTILDGILEFLYYICTPS